MIRPAEYWCGCGNRVVTHCRCMWRLQRGPRLSRDALFFTVGGLVFGSIGFCLGMGFAMVVG